MKRPTPTRSTGHAKHTHRYNSIILEIQLTSRLSSCKITNMKIDEAASRLEALGNPTRLKIYRALVRAGQAGMPVGTAAGEAQDRAVDPCRITSRSLVSVGLISQVREVHDAGLPRRIRHHAGSCRFPRCRVLRGRNRMRGDEDRRRDFSDLLFRYILET